MAGEVERHEGWGIIDRLKNCQDFTTVKVKVKSTSVKTSSQTEINAEELDVQEIPAPHVPPEHQGDPMNNLICKDNESGEGGEELENAKDNGVWSNRDLLNQLHAVAVGIRDFEVLGAKPPNLTQLVGEVKDKRVRAKNITSDNSTKSNVKEPSEKKLSTARKGTSKVRKEIIVNESKARDKLAFSDCYLERAFGLSKPTQLSEKSYANTAAKEPTNISSAKKPLKAKVLATNQSAPVSTGDMIKLVKKEALKRELQVDPAEELTTKKKIKVPAKISTNKRIHVLPHEKRVLPESAVAQVVAAKDQRDAAGAEIKKLLDEIRGMTNDNFDDLPSDVTERWIGAHAKKLRNSFDFHSIVIRHTLSSLLPKD